MELDKNYEPSQLENKWYQYWNDNGFFRSVPDEREPFTIVIPPPNVTGVLHLGHMLNNTIQDMLIRKARMDGKNACWVPGTDHASIATEAKVVGMLREKGIKKSDLTREAFLDYAFEWKDKYGGIILEQLKKLGASCDWERTRFTMEPSLSNAVIKSFIHLYEKGFIYRGLKMINWDPAAKTTLSNEEVIYKDEKSKLYHIRYRFENSEEYLVIATTRPETLLGDTAVCVHPKDERYTHLINARLVVPLVNRIVPLIKDEYVDPEFGTGALKVTPAHDVNDYELGIKHKLESIDVMNDDGTISPQGILYIGMDRFACRKQIVKDLEAAGLLEKVEDISNKVGYSERTDSVVEPRLSMQWFVKMDDLVKPALEHVLNDDITFYPDRFKNTYKHWLENIRDWPISRQLWWGQQIPAFYHESGAFAVAENAELAAEIINKQGIQCSAKDLKQDEDVLDTWFSSWLWPISVFDGFTEEGQKELNYYYPTQVLVTGWDIIFFWVARMIIAGYEFKNEMPFEKVYFTGMVRDNQRRKMSKSLGNSPDLLELIEKYGADGVRFGVLACSPAGGDLIFDAPIDPKTKKVLNQSALCEQGRNFCNKMWNALRLIKGWESTPQDNPEHEIAHEWMKNRLAAFSQEYQKLFNEFKFSELLIDLYKLVWDDFCSYYLELIKPEYQMPAPQKSIDNATSIFEDLCKLIHPYMPFISEEIWQALHPRTTQESLIITRQPALSAYDENIILAGNYARDLITGIRDIRARSGIKNKDSVKTYILGQLPQSLTAFYPLIAKLSNSESIEQTIEEMPQFASFVFLETRVFVDTGIELNAEEERLKIAKEIEYIKGFISSVEKKLQNEKFVGSAPPAVVDAEKKKLADGQSRLNALEESLKALA